jgi:hypothetical protein
LLASFITIAAQAIDPNNEPPAFLNDRYAELSPNGADRYKVVGERLGRLHEAEPTLNIEDLATIPCRTLVMLGDE